MLQNATRELLAYTSRNVLMHVFGLNESGGHSNERVKVTFFVEHDNSLTSVQNVR